MLTRLHSDLRSAWRGVLAGRLSSLVAVVVLAVGIVVSITAAAVAYGGLLRLGVAIGLGLSAMLARAASALIVGVAPRDPLTYGVTAAAVLGGALAACYLPARRAAASDPVVLLRSE